MTKREEFAKAAMQGILANRDWLRLVFCEKLQNATRGQVMEYYAADACFLADALIDMLDDTSAAQPDVTTTRSDGIT